MSSTHHHPHHHANHADHAGHAAHPPGLAELLELDGEVLAPYLQDAVGWADRSLSPAPRRILDLGTGTGTGALALARQFPAAQVTAIDADPAMLARVQAKVDELGLTDRVRPLRLDLNTASLPVGEVDLVWMALALHELSEPARLFDAVRAVLAPDGAFAVVEMDALPRFLPDDLGLGRPGFENRCHAAVAAQQGDVNPHPDWGPVLAASGFAVERRSITVDLPAPVPTAARRYAFLSLDRLRPAIDSHLDADDRSTLEVLLGDGPESLRDRADLVVRGGRTAWLARPTEI